jgi:hypothetical protein
VTAPASCPRLVVIVPLEGEPVAFVDALTDAEAVRLADWLDRREYHEAIRELVPAWPVATGAAA